MVACAEFLGRDQSTCTRGVACICKKGDKKQVSPEKMVNDSQWTAIDYANPETFPDENRVCLVAWSYDSGVREMSAPKGRAACNPCGD